MRDFFCWRSDSYLCANSCSGNIGGSWLEANAMSAIERQKADCLSDCPPIIPDDSGGGGGGGGGECTSCWCNPIPENCTTGCFDCWCDSSLCGGGFGDDVCYECWYDTFYCNFKFSLEYFDFCSMSADGKGYYDCNGVYHKWD